MIINSEAQMNHPFCIHSITLFFSNFVKGKVILILESVSKLVTKATGRITIEMQNHIERN